MEESIKIGPAAVKRFEIHHEMRAEKTTYYYPILLPF